MYFAWHKCLPACFTVPLSALPTPDYHRSNAGVIYCCCKKGACACVWHPSVLVYYCRMHAILLRALFLVSATFVHTTFSLKTLKEDVCRVWTEQSYLILVRTWNMPYNVHELLIVAACNNSLLLPGTAAVLPIKW